MTDDVRAAAERIVRSVHETVYTGPLQLQAKLADALIVADAYLAEHPADDGRPVIEGWLELNGCEPDDLSWHGHGERTGYVLNNRLGFLELPAGEWAAYLLGPDGFDGSEDWLTPTPTRGHVRRLCAALGIPLTEAPK